MSNSNSLQRTKSSKLFFICPFSSMETYLAALFGQENLHLNFFGSVVQDVNHDGFKWLKDFCINEKINQIYIVSETSSALVTAILNRDFTVKFPERAIIEELVDKNYSTLLNGQLPIVQKIRLSEIIVQLQMTKISRHPKFSDFLSNHGIEVFGLITSKEHHLSKKLECKHLTYLRRMYE